METEVIVVNSGGTVHTRPFAAPEKLAVQLNVHKTTSGGATVTVIPQISGDGGRNWYSKSSLTLHPSSSADPNAVTAMYGGDDGSVPNFGLMRLGISANAVVTVEVFVHGRGKRRARSRPVYDGIVPVASLYSEPFAIDLTTQAAALQAIATPVGANTSPTLTVQLEVTHDGNNWGNQSGTAEINAVSLQVRQENSLFADLDLTAARGLTARFRLLSGSGGADNSTHVRLYLTEWITGRDDLVNSMLPIHSLHSNDTLRREHGKARLALGERDP